MISRDELLKQLRAMPSSLNDACRTMEMAAEYIDRTPVMNITDDRVSLACEVYAEVYHDDDKDMGDAMRAALTSVMHHAQRQPNRMDKGRAFYLAMYEKNGAIWAANDHKGLWCDMAEDYERRISTVTSADGGGK